MLNQALELFKSEYEKFGEAMILDKYIPADGTYIVVKPENNNFKIEEVLEIKFDKKTRDIDRTNKYMPFICLADYYSKLIDMNKPIDSNKVIHSNNYLSFAVKQLNFDPKKGKLTSKIIEDYYKVLENPMLKYKKTKKATELYELVEKKVGKVDSVKLNKIKEWVNSNIFNFSFENYGNLYFKIFFYYPKEEYEREGNRYLIPNIFNNNDFNIKVDNKYFGLPNDNMGLNSKKPYLENKTRKVSTPYLVNLDDVLLQKKFFDYLMIQATMGKVNIYMNEKIKAIDSKSTIEYDFSGIFLRIKKGKEVEIHDFDIIPLYRPNLIKKFQYENVLEIDIEKLKADYTPRKTLKDMQNLINEVFFNKFLIPNYFTEPKDISINDNVLFNNLLLSRNALFNWFYKGIDINIWSILNIVTLNLLKGSMSNGYYTKSLDQFNLRHSLKAYFEGGRLMADIISETKQNLRNKISKKDTDLIESDKEYFFAIGQLVSFFISRSKGKKKPLSLANPFINAKRDIMIKEKLKALYKKYNYDIESKSYRFKNLYAMVMSYEVNGKIDDDMIIAGYLHSNLIYEKGQEENDNE